MSLFDLGDFAVHVAIGGIGHADGPVGLLDIAGVIEHDGEATTRVQQVGQHERPAVVNNSGERSGIACLKDTRRKTTGSCAVVVRDEHCDAPQEKAERSKKGNATEHWYNGAGEG